MSELARAKRAASSEGGRGDTDTPDLTSVRSEGVRSHPLESKSMLSAVMLAKQNAEPLSDSGALAGVRFGMASAVLSAVVLVLSLRPLSKHRIALVASLLTIALVDSMADAYALFNAVGDLGTAATSIAAKFAVCGSLAAVAYFSNRTARGMKHGQRVLFALTATFVVGQLALTVATSEQKDRTKEIGILVALFVGAVVLSLGLNRIVASLERR